MRLVTSQLATPGPLVLSRPAPAPRAAPPVLWPRYLNGHTRFVRIPASQIPPGWQSVQFTVPMRLATCEETRCPMFLRGWTGIAQGVVGRYDDDGHAVGFEPNVITVKVGEVTRDEAVETWGERDTTVVNHPPGTPCPRIHKVPSGQPPLYTVNGRTVLWSEFEDSLGGGIHRAQAIAGK